MLPIRSSSYKPHAGHKCRQPNCKSDWISYVEGQEITHWFLLRYFATTFKQNYTAAGAELVWLQAPDYQSCFQSLCYIQSGQQNKLFTPVGTWRPAEISWRKRRRRRSCSRSWSPQPSAATSTRQHVTWSCSCGRMLWTAAIRQVWKISASLLWMVQLFTVYALWVNFFSLIAWDTE